MFVSVNSLTTTFPSGTDEQVDGRRTPTRLARISPRPIRIRGLSGRLRVVGIYDTAPTTLYAARGRLIPFNSNSPTGSTFTAFSTFVSTGLMRICPGLASSQRREATLEPSQWRHNRIALKADSAKRRKAMRDTDAEANVVSPTTPRFGQGSDCVTHFKRHEHRLKRRVLHRHRIIEDHHHAVTSVAFERAVVLDDDFADCRMIVAQQGHHVFRVGALGEAGEPAQVTEQRGNLPSMAFELPLAPRRNDQIGYLRGKKRRSLLMRSISPT